MLWRKIFFMATGPFSISLSEGASNWERGRSQPPTPAQPGLLRCGEGGGLAPVEQGRPSPPLACPQPGVCGRSDRQMGGLIAFLATALGPAAEECRREVTGGLLGDRAAVCRTRMCMCIQMATQTSPA